MLKPWTVLSSNVVLDTHSVRVRKDTVELANGRVLDDYYVFEICEWATIVPITREGQLVLVEQYRHGTGRVTLEFPAGLVDSQDESHLTTAQRELMEETGYTGSQWDFIGTYHLGPSKIQNSFHIYCARNCELTCPQQLDHTEDIRVVLASPAEFDRLLEERRVSDVDSVIGYLQCLRKGYLSL